MEPDCDILIVEDSLTQALKLQRILTRHGCRTALVRSGREALAALETQTPTLVLTETVMPEMDGYELCRRIKAQAHFQTITVVLLNSFTDPDGAQKAVGCGADHWLAKPYEDHSLLSLIDAVQAAPLPEAARLRNLLLSAYGTAVQRTTELREMRDQLERLQEEQEKQEAAPDASGKLHILLAEDSLVNQQFARRALEKAGHVVTVAGDGRQALTALENAAFDLVLMDMEMPEMGGLAATEAIRRGEQGTNAHLPVIAMTAHDAQEDLDRCLAAGMDGYLPKPLQLTALDAVLARLAAPSAAAPTPAPEPEPSKPTAPLVWDRADALARVDGDEELLREILQLFQDEAPAQTAQIRQAVSTQDAPLLERAAHTLKGAAASISALAVVAAALRLETMSRARNFSETEAARLALEHALEALTPVLADFGKE